MQIIVTKYGGDDLIQLACSYTLGGASSKMTANKMYRCEHSPMRIIQFAVEMIDIPTFVSVHLVRHKIGVEHWVKSNREDRPGYSGDTGRNHPVSHLMWINPQGLINIARKRLCYQTHEKTREVIIRVKEEIEKIDLDLARRMVPECIYRGGFCHELKMCGKMEGIKRGD